MLRAIAGSNPLASVEKQVCRAAAATQLQAARLPRAIRPQSAAVFSPAGPSFGRAHVATKGIRDEGDFGARDPTAGETATQFGNKDYGNSDTDHLRRPPPGMEQFVGLKSKKCAPCEGGNVPKLSSDAVERLRIQVGWRLVTTEGGKEAIRHDWKVKNFKAGIDLFCRIADIAEEEGHHPDLHLVGYQNAEVVLTTHSVGGLTENDFIMAAKINDVRKEDLLSKRKARYWA